MAIPLSKIASSINSVMPANFPDEFRETIQTAVQAVIGKMNLVTRAEIDDQERKLLQLRKKLEAMEELVENLQQEKQTTKKSQQESVL